MGTVRDEAGKMVCKGPVGPGEAVWIKARGVCPGVGLALGGGGTGVPVMISKGACPLGLDLGSTGITGPQNVLKHLFEPRCWWPVHLGQDFRLWL